MAEYPLRPLGELCEVTIGRQRSPRHATGDNMVPYLRSANVKVGHLALEDVKLMNFTPSEQEVYQLEPGDVLVTEGCGSPQELGASATWSGEISEPVCFQNTLLRLRSIDGVSNPKYLSAIATWCHRFGRWLEASSGTSILHIGLNRAKAIRVPSPHIEIQRVIGEFLSAYDELIENNTRRIEILEEMAQAIYREWFVGFRYPGHEGVPLVGSELGPIPEGWEVRELREVVRVNEHSLKAGAEIGEIQYVDIASVDVGRISKTQTIEFSKAPGRARRKGQHGDIIWSTVRPNRRAYAQLIDPPTNLVMSTGFAVISPVSLPSSLLKQMLSTDAFVDYLSSRATGATYPAVTPSVFEEARFVVADEATNSKFNELAEPIDTLIAFLRSEIEILTETRDMLLPKLISGEIDVSELDIELADSSV